MSAPSSPATLPEARTVDLFAPGLRGLTLGLVLTITLAALESLAIGTVMPVVAADLGGIELYGWVYSAFFLGSLVGIVVTGGALDRMPLWRPTNLLEARGELEAVGTELIGDIAWASEAFADPSLEGFGWQFFHPPDGHVHVLQQERPPRRGPVGADRWPQSWSATRCRRSRTMVDCSGPSKRSMRCLDVGPTRPVKGRPLGCSIGSLGIGPRLALA